MLILLYFLVITSRVSFSQITFYEVGVSVNSLNMKKKYPRKFLIFIWVLYVKHYFKQIKFQYALRNIHEEFLFIGYLSVHVIC
jgi:hypothetical protein